MTPEKKTVALLASCTFGVENPHMHTAGRQCEETCVRTARTACLKKNITQGEEAS